MDLQQRSRRFSLAVIACTMLLRLFHSGLPEKMAVWLEQSDIAPFLIYLETGRDVRFSASMEFFWPFSPESAPPVPKKEPDKPVFSAEDTVLTDIYYACSLRPSPEDLLEAPLDWNLADGQPAVLILHTHSTESYTKTGEIYTQISDYRTLDENYNMLSIGDRVAELLEAEGIRVIHDREFHDYPDYNTAYTHARKGVQSLLKQNPGIQLVLDLHRDASESSGSQLRTHALVNGADSSQLMIVLGTGNSGLPNEGWEDNLSLALKLQATLEGQAPGICRPISLRSQRFNQDLAPHALLVEVGAAGDSHEEALVAAEQLAKALAVLKYGTE